MNKNTELLKSFYACYEKADFDGMFKLCSDDVTFQVSGKSKLAGKYTKANAKTDLFGKAHELSDGTLKSEIHDITATDRHGMVLTTNTVQKNGTKQEYRSVHVWRIQNDQLVAWYEYPRDMYQYDLIWS